MVKKALQLQIGDLVYDYADHWVMDGFTYDGFGIWLSHRDGKRRPRVIPLESEATFSVYAREALDG
jgi:hypothetical protein